MQAYLDRLVTLADEQIAAVKNLDRNFSETSLILLDKIWEGFTETSGRTKQFVEEMTVAAVQFFRDAQKFETKLASPDAQEFHASMAAIQPESGRTYGQSKEDGVELRGVKVGLR